MIKDTQLTTAKIESKLYDSFKIEAYRNKITYKDFIETCITLYLTDEDFKDLINKNKFKK